MMNYLRLIKYKTLLLIAFIQIVFRYGFLKLNAIELALTATQYNLLLLATILIASGGFVINEIFSQSSIITQSKNNTPDNMISENSAYNIYAALTVAGVVIGYYLSNAIQRPSFLVFFILFATVAYFYATQLKNVALLGNCIAALLIPFAILIIGFFDLFPATDYSNKAIMQTYFSILLDYALMAFLINLIYECIKDLKPLRNAQDSTAQTFFEVHKRNKMIYFVLFLLLLSMLLILIYVNNYLVKNELFYATFYLLFFVVAPLLYVFIRLITARIQAEFQELKVILKWIIFFGTLSLFIISKNIIHNVQ